MSNGIVLKRLFFEARYDKSFSFNDTRTLNSLDKMSKEHFTDREYVEKDEIVLMVNSSQTVGANIKSDRFLINFNRNVDEESARKQIGHIADNFIKALEIDEFNRIGMRAIWGKGVSEITDANNLLKESFLNNSLLIEEFGDITAPVHVRFSKMFDDTNIIYNIAPAHDKTVEIHGNAPVKSNNDTYIAVDIDTIFEKRFDSKKLNEFVGNLLKHQIQSSRKFNDIFDKTLELMK